MQKNSKKVNEAIHEKRDSFLYLLAIPLQNTLQVSLLKQTLTYNNLELNLVIQHES